MKDSFRWSGVVSVPRSFAKSSLSVVVGLLLFSGSARAEHTRVTHPSTVGIEILGRGIAYSLFWDRVLSDELVAGIGIGGVGIESPSGTSSTVVPVYFNYYFARQQGSLYATGGATLLTETVRGGSTTIGGVPVGSPVLPTAGLGYENRSDAGYLFRAAAYVFVGEKVVPWAGMTLGYSF